MYSFYAVVFGIVHKEYGTVLQSPLFDSLEMQRSLKRQISHHAGSSRKAFAIEVKTLDEEVSMVETCHCIALMIVLHVLTEVVAILLAEMLRS